MANFATHISVASVASAMLSTVCLKAGVLSLPYAVTAFVIGSLAGILPDIDADHSTSIRWIFRALGFAGGLCFFLLYQHQWPILQLWLGLSVMYLLITWPVRWAFEQFTVHRGIFHSLLACCLFALLVCALSYYLLHKPMIAWVFACFTFFGAMLHLLLDECFSVDLMNQRVKRSFGTALKLWDYQHLVASLLMLCVCLLLLFVVPSIQSLLVLPSLFGQIYWW